MELFTPSHWTDYELLDCGDLEKLERFGNLVLRRPEPQALWTKQWAENIWQEKADVKFIQKGSHGGEWNKKGNTPDKWQIVYKSPDFKTKFNLSLTSFKHIGIFPEQALNWDYIYNKCKLVNDPKVLNLFAYTGGASLAAKAAGADVTHVDSIKQVVSWSRENMESSGLTDIRWVVEDALKFVKREVKRGKKYNGIILDPPAYGMGANGERWKLEDSIQEILNDISNLLAEQHYLVLNVYSLGLSPLILENLIATNFKNAEALQLGEVYLPAQSGVKLPLGILARFSNIQ